MHAVQQGQGKIFLEVENEGGVEKVSVHCGRVFPDQRLFSPSVEERIDLITAHVAFPAAVSLLGPSCPLSWVITAASCPSVRPRVSILSPGREEGTVSVLITT